MVKTLEGNTQVIPGGPAASQEVIKMVGTNGGGFFNVNGAHPLSNPNGFSDLFGIFLILVIPFALTWTYGKMVGSISARAWCCSRSWSRSGRSSSG